MISTAKNRGTSGMSPLPRITVVTPTFNSINTVRETIESVRSQNYPSLEHLVIDGGSKDGTLDVLKEYPHVSWVSEKDEGHYHAMNKGIQSAAGEIVNILNSDDCYRPGVLEKVGTAFARHREWDGLFGDIVYVDGQGKEIYRRTEALFDYDVLRFSRVCYVIHQTLFVRKSVHDRLGLYRHEDFLNSCDYEFILRLGRAGYSIGHLPEFLIDYRYHQHGQSADLRVTRNMAREGAIILREHGVPDGVRGKILRVIYRAKRQFQKLRYRGRIDMVPGTWFLRKHMRAKTNFMSNFSVDKL
jgi:glycosyltransferase involved in cell wall biosynthesis